MTLGRHQIHIKVFNELCKCCLKKQSLTSVCRELQIVLAIACLGGGFYRTPLANNSNRCHSCLVLGSLFGERSGASGALSSPLFGDFMYFTFLNVYITGCFYCIRFSYNPFTWTLVLPVPPQIPFLNSLFPPSPYLTPLFPLTAFLINP